MCALNVHAYDLNRRQTQAELSLILVVIFESSIYDEGILSEGFCPEGVLSARCSACMKSIHINHRHYWPV